MIQIEIDELVQLMQDIPEMELRFGDVGMVCSRWLGVMSAYEVEFHRHSQSCCVRALLTPEQVRARTEAPGWLLAGGQTW